MVRRYKRLRHNFPTAEAKRIATEAPKLTSREKNELREVIASALARTPET